MESSDGEGDTEDEIEESEMQLPVGPALFGRTCRVYVEREEEEEEEMDEEEEEEELPQPASPPTAPPPPLKSEQPLHHSHHHHHHHHHHQLHASIPPLPAAGPERCVHR